MSQHESDVRGARSRPDRAIFQDARKPTADLTLPVFPEHLDRMDH